MLCFYLQDTVASRQHQEQLLEVLHSQEYHSTPGQQIAGMTEPQAPEEHEAHEEAPEE
jgi:hypothetical protein